MVTGNLENRVRSLLSWRDNSAESIFAKNVAGDTRAYQVTENDDLFAVINDALERAGKQGHVIVENSRFTKETGKAVESKITTEYEGQTVDFRGSNIELADNVNISSMVEVQHDSTEILRANLDANRANNSDIQSCITNTGSIKDLNVEDVEVSSAPAGLSFTSLEESDLTKAGTTEGEGSVDKVIHMEDCTSTTVLNPKITDFSNIGLEVVDCSSMEFRIVTINPKDQDADLGIRLAGVQDSRIGASIQAEGGLNKGIRTEAYDVGGTDETISTDNDYTVKIKGVNDIGVHISDAGFERVRGSVDGELPNGRTNQAFLVDSPNNLESPQHRIDLGGKKLDKITETQQTGSNVALKLTGHYSEITNSSLIEAGGSSVVSITQAQSGKQIQTAQGTQVEFKAETKRDTTNGSGEVNISWDGKYAFGSDPILSVSLKRAGQWHVQNLSTNADGRITGATIQVTDSSGTPVGSGVEVSMKVLGA